MPGLLAQHIFSVKGTRTYLDDKEMQVIGLRCSNGIISDKATDELIENLDEFKSYGINTISVFFMGSRFGDVRGYLEDASLNPVYTRRMAKVIEACDSREMVVLVGCLYWGTSDNKWESWKQEKAERAVANTAGWLLENNYRNVLVDPDNEGMATRFAGFDYSALIAAGKKAAPGILMGFNNHGYPPSNADIALHFSDRDPSKPYIESEGTMTDYWGAYSKEKELYGYINVGVYTPGKKEEQKANTRRILGDGDGYMMASTWLQDIPPNHHPGGDGTPCDPGIRWWLEFIKDK